MQTADNYFYNHIDMLRPLLFIKVFFFVFEPNILLLFKKTFTAKNNGAHFNEFI